MMRGENWRLQYKGLHDLCFTCGKYRHRKVGCPLKKTAKNEETAGANVARNKEATSLETNRKSDEQPFSFRPWMVVQCNRRRTPRPQRRNLGNTKDGTTGDEGGDQVGITAKQPTVNGDQLRSRQSIVKQSVVNGDQLRSCQSIVKPSAEHKEPAKTLLSRGTDPTRAQLGEPVAAKQTSSSKGQIKLSSKGSNKLGLRVTVLGDSSETTDGEEVIEIQDN